MAILSREQAEKIALLEAETSTLADELDKMTRLKDLAIGSLQEEVLRWRGEARSKEQHLQGRTSQVEAELEALRLEVQGLQLERDSATAKLERAAAECASLRQELRTSRQEVAQGRINEVKLRAEADAALADARTLQVFTLVGL